MQTFYGVVKNIRKAKFGGFITLETFEKNGRYQCVFKNGHDVNLYSLESYVKIVGTLVPANIKQALVVSDFEIDVQSIEVLTKPSEIPSINIFEPDILADVNAIFDARPYTLRNDKNKCVFIIQSSIIDLFRSRLDSEDFKSISTPKIVANGAEGGTEVFKLDYFGKEAYLAQSPQFYKQMMCGVFGKVYETGSVFRAEKHASSRHMNEYTSLDVETILKESFLELINLEKTVLSEIFHWIKYENKQQLDYLSLTQDSLGDPRNAVTLKVSEVKEILGTEGYDMSSQEEKDIAAWAKEKLGTEFVFVTHFHKSVKPFYTKLSPDGITTESFDLIYKGVEITSGGQRKHDYQEYIEAIKEQGMNPTQFESYLQTFKYGMPLHGGFAIGLERLTAKICGLESAKAATLFPRDVNRLEP